mgnify:CR=1 FL=1
MNEKMKSDFRHYVHQVIKSAFGDDVKLKDMTGMTFRQVLSEIERCFPEAVILWGAYAENQLNFTL